MAVTDSRKLTVFNPLIITFGNSAQVHTLNFFLILRLKTLQQNCDTIKDVCQIPIYHFQTALLGKLQMKPFLSAF